MVWHGTDCTSMSASTRPIVSASRPTGASTWTGLWVPTSASRGVLWMEKRLPRADIAGHTCQHALEPGERGTDLHPVWKQLVLADRQLVDAGALLHHRDGLAYLPLGLEEAQEHHSVAQKGHVDGV